jgi:hypothetical protein
LFLVVYYPRMGGTTDYLFIHTTTYLTELINNLPAYALITAYKQKQLPLRGCATDDLLARALALVADGEDWFMMSCGDCAQPAIEQDGRLVFWWISEPDRVGLESHVALGGSSHQELRERFVQERGRYIAFGPDFPFAQNNETGEDTNMLTAKVDDLRNAR